MKEIYHYILLPLITFILLSLPGLRIAEALLSSDLGEPWSDVADLMDARDYAGAIKKLKTFAESSDDIGYRAELYYRIGFVYFEYIHDYGLALDAYRKVVEIGRSSGSVSPDLEVYTVLSQMSIADIYRRTGKYDDAIKTYREVALNYPGTRYSEIAEKNIKNVEDSLKEIQSYEQTIAKYPDTEFSAEIQFEIAELYLSPQTLNNPQRAIQEYAKLVERYPESGRSAEAQLKIGNIYWKVLHKPEDAISAYMKLLDSQPSANKLGAEAIFRIGMIYYSDLHDYAKASEAFARFLREYPTYWKFPAGVYWQGMCYEQLKDYDNAIRAFELLVQIYPDEEPNWLADIGRFGERGVRSRIEAKLEELKRLAPEAKWNKAEEFSREGDYRSALSAYRDLMSKYPDSEYARKAKVQAEKIEYLAEIQICQDAIKSGDRNAPSAQYRIAEIYETEMQDYPKAISEYEKVYTNYPRSYWAARALYEIGLIYSGTNVRQSKEDKAARKVKKTDFNKAIEKFRQVIQEYPNTYTAAESHYQIGEIYRVHLRDYKRALEEYTKVVNDYPKRSFYVGDGYRDSLSDEASFKIGRIYYENLHNYDMALRTFAKFLTDYPDSCRKAAAYSFIAAIHEERKDHKEAIRSLEQIIDIIVESNIQSSFFIRDSFPGIKSPGSSMQSFDLQRDIIKQLRQKVTQLQGQG